MEKLKISITSLITIILICACSVCASATIWELGLSGPGINPFTAKGFAIKTENGRIQWLYSKFDNGGYDTNGNMYMGDWNEAPTIYTGVDNGVQYINTTKADGTPYQLYAFTNRNPSHQGEDTYKSMFAYYKNNDNGDYKKIEAFSEKLGAPIRTSDDLIEFPNGSRQQWAIPINNFTFAAGTRYEFGFYQGMQANNGITLTLAQKAKANSTDPDYYYGYYQTPTGDELTIYNAHKDIEYQFVSSYSLAGNDGLNYYSVNFVPMRFSVQTYADLTTWNTKAQEVQSYINKIINSNYDSGRYSKTSIANLQTKLDTLQSKTDTEVKKMLQTEAETKMKSMSVEIDKAIENLKNGTDEADISELNTRLEEATELYNSVKNKVGTENGKYGEKEVAALKQAIDSASLFTKKDLQSDINKAVANLESATIAVKASKVVKDIVLTDFVNGIKVILKNGSVPDNVSLQVIRLEKTDEKYDTIEKNLGDKVENLVVYNILLFSGDKKIQPTKSFTVQFPILDSMSKYKISAYYASTDLEPERITSTRSNSSILISHDKMGYFSLASFGEKLENPKLETNNDISEQDSNGQNELNNSDKMPLQSAPGQDATVDVIKQTDQNIDKEPDQVENALDIIDGATEDKSMSITLNGEDALKEAVEKTAIPEDEIQKESNPVWLLISSSVLGTVGISFGIIELIRRLKS